VQWPAFADAFIFHPAVPDRTFTKADGSHEELPAITHPVNDVQLSFREFSAGRIHFSGFQRKCA
jgi:hypothetical protein